MKAILVDDEPLALSHLAEELERIGGVDIIGKFRNPQAAFEGICRERPQVVFLDIDMPGMNGIELAERILQTLPETMVVFVTVYDEHAVKAFELNAQDYILKPLRHDRLTKTMARLTRRFSLQPTFPPREQATIHCFHSLRFERGGQEAGTFRWKTLKSQELFAYLLLNHGKPLRKMTILDQIWPGSEWKKGVAQLYTAVYQIRRMMEKEGIGIQVVNGDEGYELDLNGTELDTELWEKQLKEAPALSEASLDMHLRLSQLYIGDYLGEYSYEWAESEQQRLRTLWYQHAKQIADYYLSRDRISEATAFYLRIQTVRPSEEKVYFKLMRLFDRLDDRFSVKKQYDRLIHMLRHEYDAEPHSDVRKWFEEWTQRG